MKSSSSRSWLAEGGPVKRSKKALAISIVSTNPKYVPLSLRIGADKIPRKQSCFNVWAREAVGESEKTPLGGLDNR